MKHIEVDCHFVKGKVMTTSKHIHSVTKESINYICHKLSAYNLYVPT